MSFRLKLLVTGGMNVKYKYLQIIKAIGSMTDSNRVTQVPIIWFYPAVTLEVLFIVITRLLTSYPPSNYFILLTVKCDPFRYLNQHFSFQIVSISGLRFVLYCHIFTKFSTVYVNKPFIFVEHQMHQIPYQPKSSLSSMLQWICMYCKVYYLLLVVLPWLIWISKYYVAFNING